MSNPVTTYQQNRARIPLEQLQQHDGRWVAFNCDGTRIIAGAEDMASLTMELSSAGVNAGDVVFERIELDDETFLGAAELL